MPWLFKAEPDPRLVNGVDVSFGAEHFEKVQTTSWEGVRNYQARGYLRDQIKRGEYVLFYHSSTKVIRDGYPDATAWEKGHPYFDPQSDPAKPRWYMVDVKFVRRLRYFVPLALLQYLAQGVSSAQRKDVAYLSDTHLKSIASMPLLQRSRLSVQPVDEVAYEAVCLLGDRGGFDAWPGKWNGQKSGTAPRTAGGTAPATPAEPRKPKRGTTPEAEAARPPPAARATPGTPAAHAPRRSPRKHARAHND